MFDAYCNIFKRCGLPYVPVEADSGMMGGGASHEFMIPCEIGEDHIVTCSSCGYSASTEVSAIAPRSGGENAAEKFPRTEVSTPGQITVSEVSAFLGVKPSDIIKTLIYSADGKAVAILLRGDHEANETKIKKTLGAAELKMADEKLILSVTGGALGFSGPVGLTIPVYADNSLRDLVNCVSGSNKKDCHFKNVNHGVDFAVTKWIDARTITENDPCPKCGSTVKLNSAIEVGHTFKLGTKYSSRLGASYLDDKGQSQTIVMGCYGIGINRILASFVESNYDAFGIKWNKETCAFHRDSYSS